MGNFECIPCTKRSENLDAESEKQSFAEAVERKTVRFWNVYKEPNENKNTLNKVNTRNKDDQIIVKPLEEEVRRQSGDKGEHQPDLSKRELDLIIE